jgi:hypothetical protein
MTKNYPILLLLFVLLLNALQATFSQLTGDESLYWMQSRHLDWGFRDHPPMTALWVSIGSKLFSSELGVRLLTVLSNAAVLVLVYRLVQPKNFWQYVLLIASVPVIHLYGFTSTPDAPLLLATALYLTIWKKFITKSNAQNALLLGACMALLVWSKYHGVLIILFALLPLKRLWFNKHFWLAAIIGIILFSPHLIWQYDNAMSTINFHLSGRNDDAWELKHIGGYLAGQLIVFNPIFLGLTLYILAKRIPKDDFSRSLYALFAGVLLLFLFYSFQGRVEPHWTTPVTLCAIILIANEWKYHASKRAIVYGLTGMVVLIGVIRIGLIADVFPPLKKEYHSHKQTVMAIHQMAKDEPVCFMNSYQLPSLYMFYTGGIAHSINNVSGGPNQYDLWHYNEFIHEKPFLFVANYNATNFDEVTIDDMQFNVRHYTDLPVLHQLEVATDETKLSVFPGDAITLQATITNHNSYPISFENNNHHISWQLLFNYKKPNQAVVEVEILDLPQNLAASESARITLSFITPQLTGKNKARLAARIDSLPQVYVSNGVTVLY